MLRLYDMAYDNNSVYKLSHIIALSPGLIRDVKADDRNEMEKFITLHINNCRQNKTQLFDVFRYIDDVTDAIGKVALSIDPELIRVMKNPSDFLIKHAIEQDPSTIRFIEDPSEDVLRKAIQRFPELIRDLKDPPDDIQYLAAKSFGGPRIRGYAQYFKFNSIKDPAIREAIADELVSVDPALIKFVPNPSLSLQTKAVRSAPASIVFIKEPHDDTQITAVSLSPRVIKYIQHPSKEIQMFAVKKNILAYGYIDEPDSEVTEYFRFNFRVPTDPLFI